MKKGCAVKFSDQILRKAIQQKKVIPENGEGMMNVILLHCKKSIEALLTDTKIRDIKDHLLTINFKIEPKKE